MEFYFLLIVVSTILVRMLVQIQLWEQISGVSLVGKILDFQSSVTSSNLVRRSKNIGAYVKVTTRAPNPCVAGSIPVALAKRADDWWLSFWKKDDAVRLRLGSGASTLINHFCSFFILTYTLPLRTGRKVKRIHAGSNPAVSANEPKK